MPFDNLGKKHFNDEQINIVNEALKVAYDNLVILSENLTPKERSKYGKVGPQKEIIIDKVKYYQQHHIESCSPEVDWEEFKLDYKDRKAASQMITRVRSIEEVLLNIRILRDHDNLKAALSDYQYTQYRNRFTGGAEFSRKIDDIKGLFPKTGKKLKPKKDKNED